MCNQCIAYKTTPWKSIGPFPLHTNSIWSMHCSLTAISTLLCHPTSPPAVLTPVEDGAVIEAGSNMYNHSGEHSAETHPTEKKGDWV